MAYIGNTVQNQGFAPAIDYFNGDGTTVTFTLSRPVASVAQLIVAIDNVIQNPSSAFTVTGNSITFTSAPLSGTNNIWVEYTSLITTYAAISQDPSVIGDITASGGYLSTGDFGNTYTDGTIVDYVTGNARITTGPADGITLYNGGTTARNPLLTLNTVGAVGVGSSPSYGTAGQLLTSQGTGAAPTWASIATPQVTTYTSGSGTYTVPSGARYLIVRMIGGGGNGGTSAPSVTSGGGGGAGGYLEGLITTLASTYSYSVGTAGGNTTFGTALFTANGGSAGTSNSATAGGGAGGTASGGYLNATGAAGGYGWASAPYYVGGTGAATPFGGGATGGGTGSGGGTSAVSYGAGGGGGVGNGGGGAGASGVIIVTAYF